MSETPISPQPAFIWRRIACENEVMREYLRTLPEARDFMLRVKRISDGDHDNEIDDIMAHSIEWIKAT